MARRSARISSRTSSTPQPTTRTSLSYDPFVHGPRTVPAKLTSLQESDEMPGSFPMSPSVSIFEQPSKRQRTSIGTPTRASAIVPAREEMHPQATHQSTVKANEEARWLGFTAMPAHTDAATKDARVSFGVATPSKSKQSEAMVHTPSFKFTFQREQSLELSPAAKSLMQEKRAEAARIKEQMKGSGEATESVADALSRKIATPKSQRTRFSDVHSAQFQKMDSIAGHASAYRKDPQRLQTIQSPSRGTPASPAAAALKRSPSKTSLLATPSKIAQTAGAKRKADVQLTKTASEHAQSSSDQESASPRKRVKCVESTTTAHTVQSSVAAASALKLEHITTPTKSSLARAGSIKSTKESRIPGPAALSTPTKSTSTQSTEKPAASLRSKTPIKAAIGLTAPSATAASKTSLLSRSPIRPHVPTVQELIHRSPAKNTVPLHQDTTTVEPVPRTPLPSQSPSRPVVEKNPFKTASPLTNSNQAGTSSLLGRFGLLRSTPVKSILRSPQRLYSDDPAKVAAGTHLATPPQLTGRSGRKVPATAPVRKHVDFSSSTKAREATKQASISPSTSATQTRVAPISEKESTSSSITYPSLDDFKQDDSLSVQKRRQSSGPSDFTFRAGSEIVFAPSSTPTKTCITPRATSAYTIRYVAPESELPAVTNTVNATKQRKIRFENAVSVAQTNASPTTTLGSKKRKFDFENNVAEKDASCENKENHPTEITDDNDRPVKRLKAGASPHALTHGAQKAQAVSEVKKRTTLGVKPKSAIGKAPEKSQKKPGTTISMARLAALAQPKKRG
ncbi:hypothetical protein AMS68_000990 [Peltaster fructicola]|uniref:Erythromycin esterase n=1 Tax=Peltaster fructicola TaxID=286661 RepID=A0A6H0XL82_9PEZI|nr:hypothetical protein AMS68_000990 [Peltaster fructicola]